MTDATAAAGRDAKLAQTLGGSLLVAHAVVVFAANASPFLPPAGASYVVTVLWTAALLTFAFGIRRSGSVVARQPVGVVALIVAAVQPIVSRVLWAVVPLDVTAPELSVMAGQALQLISLAALVVATVVIGRAGSVPHRLRWVPLIVLAVTAGAQVLLQIVGVTAPGGVDMGALAALYWAVTTIGTIGVLALGILAIVFAPGREPSPERAVTVYPPEG